MRSRRLHPLAILVSNLTNLFHCTVALRDQHLVQPALHRSAPEVASAGDHFVMRFGRVAGGFETEYRVDKSLLPMAQRGIKQVIGIRALEAERF